MAAGSTARPIDPSDVQVDATIHPDDVVIDAQATQKGPMAGTWLDRLLTPKDRLPDPSPQDVAKNRQFEQDHPYISKFMKGIYSDVSPLPGPMLMEGPISDIASTVAKSSGPEAAAFAKNVLTHPKVVDAMKSAANEWINAIPGVKALRETGKAVKTGVEVLRDAAAASKPEAEEAADGVKGLSRQDLADYVESLKRKSPAVSAPTPATPPAAAAPVDTTTGEVLKPVQPDGHFVPATQRTPRSAPAQPASAPAAAAPDTSSPVNTSAVETIPFSKPDAPAEVFKGPARTAKARALAHVLDQSGISADDFSNVSTKVLTDPTTPQGALLSQLIKRLNINQTGEISAHSVGETMFELRKLQAAPRVAQ